MRCELHFNEQVKQCPCNDGCPTGCPCPNYDCDGGDVDFDFDSILILHEKNALLIDFDGKTLDMGWQTDNDVSATGYCSTLFENNYYIFGQVLQFLIFNSRK